MPPRAHRRESEGRAEGACAGEIRFALQGRYGTARAGWQLGFGEAQDADSRDEVLATIRRVRKEVTLGQFISRGSGVFARSHRWCGVIHRQTRAGLQRWRAAACGDRLNTLVNFERAEPRSNGQFSSRANTPINLIQKTIDVIDRPLADAHSDVPRNRFRSQRYSITPARAVRWTDYAISLSKVIGRSRTRRPVA
jgi:hypothetical protein